YAREREEATRQRRWRPPGHLRDRGSRARRRQAPPRLPGERRPELPRRDGDRGAARGRAPRLRRFFEQARGRLVQPFIVRLLDRPGGNAACAHALWAACRRVRARCPHPARPARRRPRRRRIVKLGVMKLAATLLGGAALTITAWAALAPINAGSRD